MPVGVRSGAADLEKGRYPRAVGTVDVMGNDSVSSNEKGWPMTAKQLTYSGDLYANRSNATGEAAFAVLGVMPLGILAIEAVIGGILFLVSVLFFATIFFAFVGFILVYVTLWIGVFLNAFGAAVSLLTLLAGRRYMTGKLFGASGLLIHAALLGAGICGLAGIHSYVAKAQEGRMQQPAVYYESMPADAWPAIRHEDVMAQEIGESIVGEESDDIEQGFSSD